MLPFVYGNWDAVEMSHGKCQKGNGKDRRKKQAKNIQFINGINGIREQKKKHFERQTHRAMKSKITTV